jgi:ABC-type multidrug transport system ATPase subunit
VRTLNLGIERGECFGLLGPNGAGKSTSINMMVRLQGGAAGRHAGVLLRTLSSGRVAAPSAANHQQQQPQAAAS